jgi:hypothetical protein
VTGTIKPPMLLGDFLDRLSPNVRAGITKILNRTAEGPDESQCPFRLSVIASEFECNFRNSEVRRKGP